LSWQVFSEIGVLLAALALLALAGLWAANVARRADAARVRYAKRLAVLHEIDRGIIANDTTETIAEAVLRPLQDLLGVPRAIVNLFDHAKGEVEWLAAIGRSRTHIGPGVRYPLALMGNLEAMRRGEPQVIDTEALPPSEHREALLASGVRWYMAVPMLAGDELIGALSFGGERRQFPAEQLAIAHEAAAQLAIAVTQARLNEQVKRQAAELERRVRERTAELELANRELEAFAYTVSHDLRAPLRAIDGFARIFAKDYGERVDAEGQRLLGVIRGQSGRMGSLIDDLLAFSVLGRGALQPEDVEMAALAGEVWAELGPASAATCVIAPLPAARGDRGLLRLVWSNLLGNAVKYSAKRPSPLITVTGSLEEDEARYCVSDNGAGFDPRGAGKLFGVFSRLHAESEFPGSGVGLATVQRIVVRHGGRVWAEGEPDVGAKFYFSLPVRE
jgi:signal transduction histidine kinase